MSKQSESDGTDTPREVINAKAISMDTTNTEEINHTSQVQKFQKIARSGLDMNLLQQRQEILFYDEVVLYEVS